MITLSELSQFHGMTDMQNKNECSDLIVLIQMRNTVIMPTYVI